MEKSRLRIPPMANTIFAVHNQNLDWNVSYGQRKGLKLWKDQE